MKNLENELESVLAEVKVYNAKPTKASAGRVRKQLGELKKRVTGIRAELVELDRKGY